MRQAFWIFFSTLVVEFIIAPIGGRVFDHYVPKDAGIRDVIPDIPFYQWGYATVFALGAVIGIAIYRWRARKRAAHKKDPRYYVDTRVRLQKNPSSEASFTTAESHNIFTWQQTYAELTLNKTDGSSAQHVVTNFFFVFEEPIGYAWPKINTFGHKFPHHNWHGNTERSIILQVEGVIDTPLFEIIFPPIHEGSISNEKLQSATPPPSVQIKKDTPHVQAAVDEKLEKPTWHKTADYDLPVKLGVIDQALEILGAEKEVEVLTREGSRFLGRWIQQIDAGNQKQLISDLNNYRERCLNAIQGLMEVRRENEKYDDIHFILSPLKEPSILGATSNLRTAIEQLGDNPAGNFGFFIKSYVDDFDSRLREFGKWRFETERALMARRKELSG